MAGTPAAEASAALLALLVAGHALSDFVLQTDDMAAGKARWRWLLAHAGLVTAVQLALLLPFLSWGVALVGLGVGASHLLIDAAKVRLAQRATSELRAFLLDQAAHAAVLVGAWRLLVVAVHPAPVRLSGAAVTDLTRIAVVVSAYAFNWNGASAVVRGLLSGHDLGSVGGEDALRGSGRVIGILERMIVLTLVLFDEWGALGLIVAAKSIARFKELEERRFGEYYLIGTLASVLLAVASGLLVRALV